MISPVRHASETGVWELVNLSKWAHSSFIIFAFDLHMNGVSSWCSYSACAICSYLASDMRLILDMIIIYIPGVNISKYIYLTVEVTSTISNQLRIIVLTCLLKYIHVWIFSIVAIFSMILLIPCNPDINGSGIRLHMVEISWLWFCNT